MRVIPAPETITPDTPLRLDVAARLAFPGGGMTESGLRNEIAKGNLRAELIANKLFTTLTNIEEMRNRCAVPTKARESSSETPADPASPTDGSSSTEMAPDVASSARQARLRQIAQRLRGSGRKPNKSSPSTSEKSINRNSATVIPIKSE
jgi:hypothetical protein